MLCVWAVHPPKNTLPQIPATGNAYTTSADQWRYQITDIIVTAKNLKTVSIMNSLEKRRRNKRQDNGRKDRQQPFSLTLMHQRPGIRQI